MKSSVFDASVELPVSASTAFAWHTRPGAFLRLLPPWERVQLQSQAGSLHDGAMLEHRIHVLGPYRRVWRAEHFGYWENVQFCDRQVEGPFAKFEHCHRFEALDEARCRLTDRIEYALPFGPLGGLAGGWVRRRLARAFAYRHRLLRADLVRLAAFPDRSHWKIAVTGSTGLVGSALVPFLTAGGHPVVRLVRSIRPNDWNDGTTTVVWNPEKRKLDAQALEGVDAIIHLAGESIATGRWTAAKKQRIRDSRVHSTELLAETAAKLHKPPQVFFSASAIGYYPRDQGDQIWREGDAAGRSFLAEVCRAWEGATTAVEERGIRTLHGRFGMVVSGRGGALAAQLPIFRWGAAGRLGTGRQFVSWIELNDLIWAIYHTLMHEKLSGPVNFTSPHPVTNREFTKTLGHVLRRPTFLPAPASALRLALGEMADALLLSSQRVLPQKLRESGFEFEFPRLEEALQFQLGK
jgi:uncharacterized protein (TIGR01777 family)